MAGDAEREAFEATYRKRFNVPEFCPLNSFPDIDAAWEWWQAARSAPPVAAADARDAQRYRWLRNGPLQTGEHMLPAVPWVVNIAIEHGIPTMKPLSGGLLDAAIDAALPAAPVGGKEGGE